MGATLVAPGHNHVVPVPPEFIVPQDGSDKQDCESRAAGRWLGAHGAQYARLRPVYLGDDLFANQPMCEAIPVSGGNFVFTCKPASHALIGEYITGADLPTHSVRVKHGREWATHRFCRLAEVPLRDGRDVLKVNWFEIEISNAAGDITYRNSFITDMPIGCDTVADLATCGRARWKIENETFNVLNNNGSNLEHSFDHGNQHLAAPLVTLNLPAFAFHTIGDHGEALWQSARSKVSSRAQFFNNAVAITSFPIFSGWDELMQTPAFARPPPQPP